MKLRNRLVMAAATIVTGAALLSFAAETKAPTSSATKEINWTADKLVYKEVIPGVQKAVLWEDGKTGAYGALTKLVPGLRNPLHYHSNDIKIVVISGAYIYGTEAGVTRYGPGSFVLVPGGRVHTSSADEKLGAEFFEESSGKFDLVPVMATAQKR